MKYILSVSLLLFAFLSTTIAQDEKSAAELKNEGNAAFKSKDYNTALKTYEASIAAWDEAEDMDAALVYNTATCARKLKKNELSIKYYKQAKELGYKADISTYYIGKAYKSMGKEDEMEKVLLEGVKEYSTSKYLNYMKKELSTFYLKSANGFYVKGQEILNTRTSDNNDQWGAIKEKAKVEFNSATELANKSLEYNPKNTTAKTIVTKIPELLK